VGDTVITQDVVAKNSIPIDLVIMPPLTQDTEDTCDHIEILKKGIELI